MSRLVWLIIGLLCIAILSGNRASDWQEPISPNEHTSPTHKGGNTYGK